MQKLLAIAKQAALEAGAAILHIYNSENFEIDFKNDDSPLTKADKKGHEIITKHLSETEMPILSEEGKNIEFIERKNWNQYWCVDPLDGTKEFIKRNGEFTVNIALIENGEPILGVVYVPVLDKLFYGVKNQGAFLIEGQKQTKLSENNYQLGFDKLNTIKNIKVVASRSHLSAETENFINSLDNPETLSMGSSLKFLLLAEGKAQVYPRFAPTMEWDTAAAHAVLNALYYQVLAYPECSPLRYNKENLLNPWFICY